MKKYTKAVVLVAVGLGVLGRIFLFGAKAVPNVQLRATFRCETLPGAPGADYYLDKICNDARGSYTTDKTKTVAVWFTGDYGELEFRVDHNSTRSAIVVLPKEGTTCGTLPDTAKIYPELPDEPVDYLRIKTYNGPAYIGGPRLNFLQMTPGQVCRVRLWVFFDTIDRHYFMLNYDATDTGTESGIVEAVAFDDNTDGRLDRWEISPLSGSGDLARVYKHPEAGPDETNCFFGTFPMRFKLILERLK